MLPWPIGHSKSSHERLRKRQGTGGAPGRCFVLGLGWRWPLPAVAPTPLSTDSLSETQDATATALFVGPSAVPGSHRLLLGDDSRITPRHQAAASTAGDG